MTFFDPEAKREMAMAPGARIPVILDGLQRTLHYWVRTNKIKRKSNRQIYYCVDDTKKGKGKCMRLACNKVKALY